MDKPSLWYDVLNASEKILYGSLESNNQLSEIDLRSYQYPPDQEKSLLEQFKFPLLNSSIISVKGSDAQSFLQSQLTCDFKTIRKSSSTLTSWCAPNGRVRCLLTVLRTENNDTFLLIDKKHTETFLKRFSIFVLNSDVELSDVSSSQLVFISRRTSQKFNRNAGALWEVRSDSDLEWQIGSFCQIKELWCSLSIPALSPLAKILFDIYQYRPWIGVTHVEKFLPQELNLDQHGGLSFEKGCYPGQEIIARVKYRGNVKRGLRILRARRSCKAIPSCEDHLTDADGKKKGSVLSVSLSPSNHIEILCVLDLSAKTPIFSDDSREEFEIINI